MPNATDAKQLVLDFCAAWDRRDVAAILTMLAPDIVYENVPRHRMQGLAEAEAFIRPIVEETIGIELRMDAIAVADDGRTVLTERWDFLHYPAGTVELPIMGIFVVENGLITQWRDYTDGATAGEQFARVGVKLVLPQR